MSPAGNPYSDELHAALQSAPDWRPRLTSFQRDHWTVLRHSTRHYLLALFDLISRGRAAVADLMTSFDHAVDTPNIRHSQSSLSVPALRWAEEARAHRNIGNLYRWIIAQLDTDLDRHAEFAQLEIADSVFDEYLPDLADMLQDSPDDEVVFSVYATTVVVVLGVMSDTGSHAAVTLLDRHGTLAPVTRSLRRCQRFDRERVNVLLPYFAHVLADDPDLGVELEPTLNNTYMMTVGLVRAFQDQFDLARIGIMPGEFVAHAVERFTGLVAALNGSPSDLSPL